ncbi:c-type cytochrome [Flavobacterium caeni]|uniref:Cytochrome c, mono-and diheme variants n=1 Tax=Flavobacterium caeni TaxID=490189 RepID=A0A1G5II81_9FLAO|nr:cytochrome c [Flavobacterium caeni]SCY75108.1 Cytochrome c, mono-and diheme variants [Flavobacterium caeni]
MKRVYHIALLAGVAIIASSCQNTKKPNYQYMPNMYEAVSYETYAESDAFKNGKEGQLPPAGTINRGFEVYDYPNTTEGYEAAKANSKSPYGPWSEADKEKAKGLYEIYCAICHGAAGDGKGKLVKQEKFLGVPSYKDRVITEGSVFHVETYGLNAMGSHANQLSTKERWMIAAYVMELKNK